MSLTSRALSLVAAASLCAMNASAHAAMLQGQTITTIHYHGSQPDQTQSASANCVVGPGVELPSFGVSVWINGQPQPGVFNINFSDNNIKITMNANMPFSYFEALMFFDTNNTIPPFAGVTINPATNYSGFDQSDIYVSPGGGYLEIFPPFSGQAGQVISLDLADPCPPDTATPANGVVDVNDLLAVITNWGPCGGCAADLDNNGIVNVNDLLGVISGWGPCP